MGNKQSSGSKDEKSNLSESKVQGLLKECQNYVKNKAKRAPNAQAQTPQSPAPPPQPAQNFTHAAGMTRSNLSESKVQGLLEECQNYVKNEGKRAPNAQAQTPQSPAPPPQLAQNFTHAASSIHSRMTSMQRQPALYSYDRENLQNLLRASTPTAPQLYPDLNFTATSSSTPTVPLSGFVNHNPSPAQDLAFVNIIEHPERCQPSAPPLERPRRERYFRRSRNTSKDNEVNCPTCNTMFGLQIFQCSSGHSSCNTCKEYRRSCGICGNEITTQRNNARERFMAERRIPCQNRVNGCMLVIKKAEIEFHIKKCPFNEIQCPVGCTWKGKFKQLSDHFDACHPNQRMVDVDSEIHLQNITNYSRNVYLILIGVYNFLFHVNVSESTIYMTVQLIGTRMSASKWSYEVHVYDKKECRRKYTYTDVCGSYIEPVADVFKAGRCSMLPQALASTYVRNGALTYKIFIKQTFEGKTRRDIRNQRGRRS